jgi:hypothetical protein
MLGLSRDHYGAAAVGTVRESSGASAEAIARSGQ